MAGVALLALLHVLVPVYWLGGDLGAFYASHFLADPRRTVAERLLALKILNTVDMAPRTSMILAIPTGLTLAVAKRWVQAPGALVAGVVAASLLWLALAWTLHLRHGGGARVLKTADQAVRHLLIAALVTVAALGLAHRIPLPLFIALKLLIVAATIALGLLIRRQLTPLFPAVVALREAGASTLEGDRVIGGVIARTRPVVVLIWLLVLSAGYLGLAKPA